MGSNIWMNPTTRGANNFRPEQASSSEDGQSLVALINMTQEYHGKTNHILGLLASQVEDLKHKFDKFQSALEKITGGNWTDTNSVPGPNERRLQLKFLNEVSNEVLTGKEIKGKEDIPVRLAIVDETGHVVKSGPGSSAKVEILLLEANADDNGNNCGDQDLKSGEAKPRFAKTYHVFLHDGTCDLSNVRLAHDSKWTRSCKCQLKAQVVETFSGIKVQEACTEPFMVLDSRSKLYAKHYPPSLHDPVWRLVNIGRGGEPCKRLKEDNVETVQDLLFLNSVYPHRLHEIMRTGDNTLKAIKDHAQSCIIDDTRICTYGSSEHDIIVVFDVVGNLKGIIHESQYVLKSQLSEDLQARASEFLCSAFGDREHITFHYDEKALMQQFSYHASNTSSSILESVPGCSPTIPANTSHIDLTEPSTSFQSICPSGEPSGNINNTLSYHDPDWMTATNGSIQDSYPAGCNSTMDTSGQAEAPETFTSTYQPCEEVNSKDENGLHLDDFSDAVIESFLNSLEQTSLLVVDGTEVQFYSPQLQPDEPVFMPNFFQDQRAQTGSGGGESVLNRTGNSSRGMMEFTRDSLTWNKPMNRSKMQRMARKASGPVQQRLQQRMPRKAWSPEQQHGEAQSRHRSRSRSRGPQIRTAYSGREGCNCGHGRACRHSFRGGSGGHTPV